MAARSLQQRRIFLVLSQIFQFGRVKPGLVRLRSHDIEPVRDRDANELADGRQCVADRLLSRHFQQDHLLPNLSAASASSMGKAGSPNEHSGQAWCLIPAVHARCAAQPSSDPLLATFVMSPRLMYLYLIVTYPTSNALAATLPLCCLADQSRLVLTLTVPLDSVLPHSAATSAGPFSCNSQHRTSNSLSGAAT